MTAFHNGRQLAWQRPLLATLDALYGAQGLVVNKLHCESDFFTLDMAGTSDQLAADAEFKLQQLAVQLGQFVDLGELGLSGDGWAHFGWQRVGPQQFKTAAELQLRGFQLAMSDQRHWSEDELRLFFTADATSTTGRCDRKTSRRRPTANRLQHACR